MTTELRFSSVSNVSVPSEDEAIDKDRQIKEEIKNPVPCSNITVNSQRDGNKLARTKTNILVHLMTPYRISDTALINPAGLSQIPALHESKNNDNQVYYLLPGSGATGPV